MSFTIRNLIVIFFRCCFEVSVYVQGENFYIFIILDRNKLPSEI